MKKVNIIYLLPEMKGASGGAKVIYNHSLILNHIDKNISSKIVHLKKNFLYKLELSLAKKVKFFDQTYSGWDGKRMKISKKFKPKKWWAYALFYCYLVFYGYIFWMAPLSAS